MEIKKYQKKYDDELFMLLQNEGEEWSCYYGDMAKEDYKKALKNSKTYLAFEKNKLIGYIRTRDDDGFGIYIYDLLVDKNYRGNSYGKLLIEEVCKNYPNNVVYVMSDVDEYYLKLKFEKEGSIFRIDNKK